MLSADYVDYTEFGFGFGLYFWIGVFLARMKKQSNRATGKTSNSGKSVKRTRRSVVKSTMLTGAGKNGIATERPRKNERVDWLNWRPSPYVPSRWPTTIITRTKPAAYTDCSSTTDGLWEGSKRLARLTPSAYTSEMETSAQVLEYSRSLQS